ncbi:hypothetical protein BDF21DRAFT_465813 [Thamnidium elegans]|nr:hypothetical protein BDF21DRAFT_465813 [Thamnidium elegans]
MATNFKFKEDVTRVVAILENKAADSAVLSNVIVEICDLVSEEYLLLIKQPDFNLSQFKAVWIQRIIATKNNLNLTTEVGSGQYLGFNLTALLMTFKGSTSLITRSKRISLPQNVTDIPRLLPIALKLVYNASQTVKGTMDTIKKASASVILDENDDLPYFPPCHISTNKRKNPEEN